jgi:uncharacterized protein YjiS (DUF1127 family)
MRPRGFARRTVKEKTMTALDHRSSATVAGARAAVLAVRAADTLRALVRALANRRQVARLSDLSDRGLADIGLMRGDLYYARRTPLGIDPTARLASMARERVHSHRAERD